QYPDGMTDNELQVFTEQWEQKGNAKTWHRNEYGGTAVNRAKNVVYWGFKPSSKTFEPNQRGTCCHEKGAQTAIPRWHDRQ
ncbi:hypothetical protein, partial [Klebsiella quasipneumoniae]|uniref:hypothetical protein n=1 Tax=Klebsiella quasipneumoniae TaxID=1463165 RepID=UPI001C65AACD